MSLSRKNHAAYPLPFSLKGSSDPTLFVDLDQAMANLRFFESRIPGDIGIRLSSISIRSRELLQILQNNCQRPFKGILCNHPREIPVLWDYGFKDILLAYPNYGKDNLE
jgi:D-serine deaminase-like pyridoxal phosphate-dependent protein